MCQPSNITGARAVPASTCARAGSRHVQAMKNAQAGVAFLASAGGLLDGRPSLEE